MICLFCVLWLCCVLWLVCCLDWLNWLVIFAGFRVLGVGIRREIGFEGFKLVCVVWCFWMILVFWLLDLGVDGCLLGIVYSWMVGCCVWWRLFGLLICIIWFLLSVFVGCWFAVMFVVFLHFVKFVFVVCFGFRCLLVWDLSLLVISGLCFVFCNFILLGLRCEG